MSWNQCLSTLMLRVWISIRARCTTLCDKVCQWLATGQWFSLGTPVFSTNKTDHKDVTEILLKLTLNAIKQTSKQANLYIKDTNYNMKMCPLLAVVIFIYRFKLYAFYSLNGEIKTALYRQWFVIYMCPLIKACLTVVLR